MLINLWMLKDDFTEKYGSACIHFCISKPLSEISIKSYAVLTDVPPEPDVVLVLHSQFPPVLPAAQPIIFCGLPEQEALDRYTDYIAVSGPTLPQLMNDIASFFQVYQNWEIDLLYLITQRQPLYTLGQRSLPILRQPLMLSTQNFRFVFVVSDPTCDRLPPYYTNVGDYVPLEDVESMLSDSSFQKLLQQGQPEIISSNYFNSRTLIYNLRMNDKLIGQLCADELRAPLRDKDYSLIKFLGDLIVSYAALSDDVNEFYRPRNTGKILERLLHHVFIKESVIAEFLSAFGWKDTDCYFCIVTEAVNSASAEISLSSIAANLARLACSDCYLIFEHRIVLVVNLDAIHRSRDALLQQAVPALRDGLIKACFSTEFTDFKRLYDYYQQALCGLEVGTGIDSSFWYYRFEDYVIPYILKNGQGSLCADALAPAGIHRLILHDQRKGTLYLHALKTYLDCHQNIAETVRRLHVHRNTFLYQLECIQKITDMDFSNPDVVFLQSFVLRLLL